MRNRAPLLMTLALVACAPAVEPAGNIVAIGDVMLEQGAEEGLSVPDVIAGARGQQVDNRAIAGAMVLGGADRIPDQYIAGGWDWLVMDGGLGDLSGDVGCDEALDALVSADGRSGAVPDLLAPIAASGTRVAIVGYPEGAGDPGCASALEALSERYAALAGTADGILFVDTRDLSSGGDREAIGLYVAAAMTAAE